MQTYVTGNFGSENIAPDNIYSRRSHCSAILEVVTVTPSAVTLVGVLIMSAPINVTATCNDSP